MIFIKVKPIEVLIFEVRHLDKLRKLYDKFKYIHDTQSAQILQRYDGYNTYVIIENNIYIYIHTTKSAEISQKQDEYKAP